MSENQRIKKKNYKEGPKERQKKVIYVKKTSEEIIIEKNPKVLDCDPNKKVSKNIMLALYSTDFFNFFDVIKLSQEFPLCFSMKKQSPVLLFKSNKNNKKGLILPKSKWVDRDKEKEKDKHYIKFKPKHDYNKGRDDGEEKVPEWYSTEDKNIKDVTAEVNAWKTNFEYEDERIHKEIKNSLKTEDYSKIDELMEMKFKNMEILKEMEEDEIDKPIESEINAEEEEPEWGNAEVEEIKKFEKNQKSIDTIFSKGIQLDKKFGNSKYEQFNINKENDEEEDDEDDEKFKFDFKGIEMDFPQIGGNYSKPNANQIHSKDNSLNAAAIKTMNIANQLGLGGIEKFSLPKNENKKMQELDNNLNKQNNKKRNSGNSLNENKQPPPGMQKQDAKPMNIPMEKLLSRIFPPMAKFNQFLIFSIFSSKFNFDSDIEAWNYKDPYEQIQGPFSSQNMDIWNTQGYFPPNLQISWFQSQQFICLDKFRNSPESIYKLAQIYSSKVIKVSEELVKEYEEAEKLADLKKPAINFPTPMSGFPSGFQHIQHAIKPEQNLFNIQLNVSQNVYNNQINTADYGKDSVEHLVNMISKPSITANFDTIKAGNTNEIHQSTQFQFIQAKPESFISNNKSFVPTQASDKIGVKEVPRNEDNESIDFFSSLTKLKAFDEKKNSDLTASDIKKILGIGNKPSNQNANIISKPVAKSGQTQKPIEKPKNKDLEIANTDQFPSLSDIKTPIPKSQGN